MQTSNDAPKRKRGRPAFIPGEPAEPLQIRLAPSLAARLRAIGDGSVSLGIYRLLQLPLGPHIFK
jgi:hypothetical protein